MSMICFSTELAHCASDNVGMLAITWMTKKQKQNVSILDKSLPIVVTQARKLRYCKGLRRRGGAHYGATSNNS